MKKIINAAAIYRASYVIIVLSMLMLLSSCSKKEANNISSPQDELTLSSASTIIMPGEGSGTGITGNSLQNNSATNCNTFYGPVVQMGNGHARSWFNMSHDGKARAIGVEMTNRALEGLPPNPEDFAASTFILPLHQKAKQLTAFDHVMLNWNVHGHEPNHVYDIPHFDFHFYKTSVASRLAIPPYPVAPARFDANPPAGYMPPLYLHTPGGVPQMGAHWVDLLAPELNGGTFTHTFIYGSYDGQVTFEEPMITLATLQGGSTIHKAFRQPGHFSPLNKYYPARYNIWKNNSNNRHYVSLDEMVWR